uniref:AMP deaminase n=1 Tax=Pinguiococcus pyrenoidosus TaxID=172671 RepID=A0A7R9YEX5_9STRA
MAQEHEELQATAWMGLNADNELSFAERVESDAAIRRKTLRRVQNSIQDRISSLGGADEQKRDTSARSAPEAPMPSISRVPEMVSEDSAMSLPKKGAARLFQGAHTPYDHSEDFQRVIITDCEEGDTDADVVSACKELRAGLKLRDKWISQGGKNSLVVDDEGKAIEALQSVHCSLVNGYHRCSTFHRRSEPVFEAPFARELYLGDASKLPDVDVRFQEGVFRVYYKEEGKEEKEVWTPPTVSDFFHDFFRLRAIVTAGPVKSVAYKRIKLLEARFELHSMLNGERELAAQKSVPHRDFYNVRKVDTHVHHSACMNQKHLLRYIKHKLKNSEDEIVAFRDGIFLTLTEVFDSLRLSAYDLSIDTLDMHANNTFHRFDRFNLKYNPAGQSRLREIFLKTHNLIGGQYLAEITREVCDDLSASKYQHVEWRVSIYGRGLSEWDRLARWFYVNRLAHPNLRWMVQIPRLYFVYKKTGAVESFAEMLYNIFHPLFEVTRDPTSNLPLHAFLKTIVGFDSVDDESKPEPVRPYPGRSLPGPARWDNEHNPPYSYWSYYLWVNIASLNHMRAAKGLNTFTFRPHCGEAGDLDHLVASYLVADQINHGILLRKLPGLHYLFYLSQIGIAVSPLSNNKLFLDYNKNPFMKYFAQGLNVSLSTDDPLMLHYTKDPLLEEYSVAAQVWKLTPTDQCEIARNSVLQSGWEHEFKKHFIGPYWKEGEEGNDICLTNVPDIRVRYRYEVLNRELEFVGLKKGNLHEQLSDKTL